MRKALLLDGSPAGDQVLAQLSGFVADELKGQGWEVEHLLPRDMQIQYCLGCFGCWMKSPGECVVNDAGRGVARSIAQSELLIFFTPVTFGGYSAELKKAWDRAVCSQILPLMVRVQGETHHPPRYPRRPMLVGIGVLPAADTESEQTFCTLIGRNALNLQVPHRAVVLRKSDGAEAMERQIKALCEEVK